MVVGQAPFVSAVLYGSPESKFGLIVHSTAIEGFCPTSPARLGRTDPGIVAHDR